MILSKYDPVSGSIEDRSVSSCLTLLCGIHLCSVTTTEGLGGSKDGFHAIHRRIAGFHASQCGFCTPGMCISIFSALVNADKSPGAAVPPRFSKLPVAEAESAISGNLCRCTGYRPIVDSCKSFSGDVDLEDLGLNTFWRRGGAAADLLPAYSPNSVCTFPDFLKLEVSAAMNSPSIIEPLDSWIVPRSLEDLQNLEFSPEMRIKLVAGNTSAGVYKEVYSYDKYVDLRKIRELKQIRSDGGFLEIGAAVSISAVIEALEEYGGAIFTKLAEHMKKVASQFVRNTATIGGNLIMAQRGNFPSDIATILLAADAMVSVLVDYRSREISLDDFFDQPPFDQGKILVNVRIPSLVNTRGEVKLLFETFRAAPRPLGNAVSYVNAAFFARVNAEYIVESSRLAFGAYGVNHAMRARKVEDFIAGKKVNVEVILEAIRFLREVLIPDEGTSHPEYRVSAAIGFLYKFLLQLGEEKGDGIVKSQWEDLAERKLTISGTVFQNQQENGSSECGERLTSRQEIEEGVDFRPVGQAVKKVGAELQASGQLLSHSQPSLTFTIL